MIKIWTFSLLLAIGLCFSCFGQVTDIDGNSYNTVIIGSQEWMAENLRTSRTDNGDTIMEITRNNMWGSANRPAMAWYDNDTANANPFGRLYNGHAALHPNICPDGWRMPTDADWTALYNQVGGSSVAGGKLKHEGTQYWEPPNTSASNASGFTAMPSGYRDPQSGNFLHQGFRAGWFARVRQSNLMFYWVSWDTQAGGQGPIQHEAGLAIRCMRDVTTSTSSFEKDQYGIKVVPNPAEHFTTITFPEKDKDWHLTLINMNGNVVFDQHIQTNTYDLNVEHLPAGIYTIAVNSDVFTVFEKLVVY